MLILVSGGAGSGKSAFAERLITESPARPRLYAAAMRLWDDECRARAQRHRRQRQGKGFFTLECPEDLSALEIPGGSAVLVEDLANLTANVYFGPVGPERAEAHILGGVEHLTASAALTVVVTNELFADGRSYDPDTMGYLAVLAALDRALAARADGVYEVVCGLPICWKEET